MADIEHGLWTIRVCSRCGQVDDYEHWHTHHRSGHFEAVQVEVVRADAYRGAVEALREIAASNDRVPGVIAANALHDLGISDPLVERVGSTPKSSGGPMGPKNLGGQH
jgi:hypothetical protein